MSELLNTSDLVLKTTPMKLHKIPFKIDDFYCLKFFKEMHVLLLVIKNKACQINVSMVN